MSTNEILIPPWVNPQAESTTLVDDSTSVFRAAFAPGVAQRVSYVEPRLQVKQSYKGLRGQERGAMLAALRRVKGKFGTVRAVVGFNNRGSFPLTQLFSNNDFSAATISPWVSDAQYSVTLLDHGARATRAQITAGAEAIAQAVTVSTGIPYAFRIFINGGRGSVLGGPSDFTDSLSIGPSGSQGLLGGAYTTASSGAHIVGLFATQAGLAGDFFDAKWASFARCAQVDNGVNLLLNSDTPGTGTGWSLAAATAATGGAALSPDGTTDAWGLTETATTAQHFASQVVTIAAGAADYMTSFLVAANLRTWCLVQAFDGTNSISRWFNLSTAALGTLTVGTNFTHISSTCVDYGNGWKRCTICYRKSSASTSMTSVVCPATADNTGSGASPYLGSTASIALYTWRASFAQSSVPVAPVQTTAAAISGTSQIGNALNVKGLPVSTAGLLLEDDLFEVNGELKSAISAVNSDGAGLSTIYFGPALCRSPADGDGVIINKPMGKFILAADSSWQNNFGTYADIDLTMEAINE